MRRRRAGLGLALGLAGYDHSRCSSRRTFVVRSRSSMHRADTGKFRRLSVSYDVTVVEKPSPETRRAGFTVAKRPGQTGSRCASRRNLAVRSRSDMYLAVTVKVRRLLARFAPTVADTYVLRRHGHDRG